MLREPERNREEQFVMRWFEGHVRTCPECNRESYEGGPAAICPRGSEHFKKAVGPR